MSGGWTKGVWSAVEFGGVQIGGGKNHGEAICTMWDSQSRKGKANAALIAEAGTVANETGLTPRQLADQRAELLAAIGAGRTVLENINCYRGLPADQLAVLKQMQDAIRKATS